MTDPVLAPLRLTGPGLDRARLAALAAETGLDPAGAGPVVEAVAEGDAEGLTAALACDAAAIVELAAGRPFPTGRLAEALAGACVLHLSLCTRTAWSFDTAAQFCDGLAARGLLPDWLRHDVELSLHEAVVNAVLHGNLAMGGSLVDDTAEFDAFCARLSARLEDTDAAARRVELTALRRDGLLLLRVADEGAGYDPATVPRPVDITAKSGRGLEIMRTMASLMEVGEGGRAVTLGFAV
ncbi:MAG TPA: ATP-binding protein [Azospirillaceae bacterium]|nr:ATP-binding protein [Azospirillaceae bacterium]